MTAIAQFVSTSGRAELPRSLVLRRAAVIALHCAAAGARLGFSIGVGVARRRHDAQARLGAEIANLLERLGPSFVKVGQILATRADIFPAAVLAPLSRLHADLAPLALSAAEREISRSLGRPAAEIFCSLDPTPLGSASIASVYRGTLADGRQVAVKVRRPGIDATVATDVRIIRSLTAAAARTPWLRDIPLRECVDAVCRCLSEQTDLRIERENLRLLREALHRHPRVRVPATLDELCTDTVLTLELVDLGDGNPSDSDVRDAVQTALAALYELIFLHGIVHCDLHAGNLFLFADGTVTILDAGFVAKVPPEIRREFALFFFGVTIADGRLCADVALGVADAVPEDLAYDDFVRDISVLVSAVAGAPASDFSVARFVVSLFDVQRRHRVRTTAEFTTIILALLVFEGIAKSAYPDLDFQQPARRVIPLALFEREPESRDAPAFAGPSTQLQ